MQVAGKVQRIFHMKGAVYICTLRCVAFAQPVSSLWHPLQDA